MNGIDLSIPDVVVGLTYREAVTVMAAIATMMKNLDGTNDPEISRIAFVLYTANEKLREQTVAHMVDGATP